MMVRAINDCARAEQIRVESGRIAKLVAAGERDGEDALKVLNIIIEHPDFMKQLASMTIDWEKHHIRKFAGFD